MTSPDASVEAATRAVADLYDGDPDSFVRVVNVALTAAYPFLVADAVDRALTEVETAVINEVKRGATDVDAWMVVGPAVNRIRAGFAAYRKEISQ